MIRTSKASRQEEWEIFQIKAANGQMTIPQDVKRWRKLRKEFGKPSVTLRSASEKR